MTTKNDELFTATVARGAPPLVALSATIALRPADLLRPDLTWGKYLECLYHTNEDIPDHWVEGDPPYHNDEAAMSAMITPADRGRLLPGQKRALLREVSAIEHTYDLFDELRSQGGSGAQLAAVMTSHPGLNNPKTKLDELTSTLRSNYTGRHLANLLLSGVARKIVLFDASKALQRRLPTLHFDDAYQVVWKNLLLRFKREHFYELARLTLEHNDYDLMAEYVQRRLKWSLTAVSDRQFLLRGESVPTALIKATIQEVLHKVEIKDDHNKSISINSRIVDQVVHYLARATLRLAFEAERA